MLRWLSIAFVLATSRAAFVEPPQKPKSSCRGHAWVRAPDMVPGEVIGGDIKIKLTEPCTDAESYVLGLRFKERVFWRLRREDAAPLPTTVQIKDYWSVHEEERTAFEIKTDLVSAEDAVSLPTDFTTRFGILVPNTNYPPGIDYRYGSWGIAFIGDIDTMWSEFVYEYFVEIKFRNGTTSEMPAGMTGFAPFYLPTEHVAPRVNLSTARAGHATYMESDVLQSNYTIEVSEGAHLYQNSSVDTIVATVHRIGYTNRTDTPVELCAFIEQDDIEWYPQELQNRSKPITQNIRSLVPSMQPADTYPSPCQKIKFAETATNLTQEGRVSSTSSEPLSLSFRVDRSYVPDFSTYYQKLGHHVSLNLHIKPDPSDPWEDPFAKQQWEMQFEYQGIQFIKMDGIDFEWVPHSSPPSILPKTHRLFRTAQIGIFVTPVQTQGPMRSTPVHYLSDEARQPSFVDVSDIDSLRLMSSEERDLIAPLAQPSVKVFADGEQRGSRYFHVSNMQKPIYVGETWAKEVLPVVAEGHRKDTADHLLVVQ